MKNIYFVNKGKNMSYIRGLSQSNIKVVSNSTGYDTQTIYSTLAAVSGTEITYTPSLCSLGVVYECNYTIYWNPDGMGSYHCVRLQESDDGGSTWSTITGTQAMEGTYGETDYDTFICHYTHRLEPWTGSKKLRLASRSWADIADYTIGKCYTAGSQTIKSLPQVFIYEV
tara:strand:- start:1448 stop:1957 length:510 start_codon:yes stop_codon:yes gene_type:complete